MALDPTLLSILACPQDKGPLLLVDDELLYNPRLHRAYPIEDGIPVLLVDEARTVGEEEHETLLARAKGSAGD
ncbi:Trm112 family protein [Rhodococcus sp. UNC363MFTsu5.1]|uniref:Trm112 family protein n=1 Tax=Rhodococcus sp. UNC363MFTsu5.1 TaxID=1449069 RepID=UPI000484FF89|nr:Trm112 family protein [Rhodococcus sp. UNC363MFTsu5.1]